MTTTFTAEGDALVIRFGGETIRIEPWGDNALRLRAAPGAGVIEPHVSALLDKPVTAPPEIVIGPQRSTIRQGRLIAEARLQLRYGADVPKEPVIRFLDAVTGEELLSETRPHFAGPSPRNYRTIAANSFQLEATFKAHDGERLWGLGQPQHGQIDLKGTTNTLIQQNTVVVVPFVVSSRGYGFLWNNPAAGRAEFARNLTRWTAQATPGLDYWVTAGPTPRDAVRAYIPADAARLGLGFLAVQAALPHAGGASVSRARLQGARVAPILHRDRLFRLDAAGRMAVRSEGLARPRRAGGRA